MSKTMKIIPRKTSYAVKYDGTEESIQAIKELYLKGLDTNDKSVLMHVDEETGRLLIIIKERRIKLSGDPPFTKDDCYFVSNYFDKGDYMVMYPNRINNNYIINVCKPEAFRQNFTEIKDETEKRPD